MPNGSAALQLLEPPSTSVPAGKPDAATRIEVAAIGEAVADATIMLCWATLRHRQAGVLDPAVKDAGASALARAAMLQLGHELGDDDFANKARAAGRRALRQHFTEDDLQRHGPADVAAMIDLCLGETLDVIMHVVEDERTFARAMAH